MAETRVTTLKHEIVRRFGFGFTGGPILSSL